MPELRPRRLGGRRRGIGIVLRPHFVRPLRRRVPAGQFFEGVCWCSGLVLSRLRQRGRGIMLIGTVSGGFLFLGQSRSTQG